MHALDNVIWNALTTRQAEFAESHAEARRFAPEVTQLAGFNASTDAGYASLKGLLADRGTLALFLAEPYQARAGCELAASGSVWQMVCENGNGLSPSADDSEFELIELGVADSPEMIELTALTKPGPFGKRTHELGTYLGIRRDGKLVAMAGERLKVLAFTEVSAVCTHPQHAGHGYARVLMMEVMRRIRERGETPFLHVREDNARAIALYERIGFRRRVVSHLAVLRRVAAEEYSVTRQ